MKSLSEYKFSVLMPVYHKETTEYFNTALESVVNQTLMPNEIVIVKDGSLTEELNSVIAKYISKYSQLFNIVAWEENVGQGKARNAGLMACKHNIVALMDGDDIAEKLQYGLYYLKNRNVLWEICILVKAVFLALGGRHE